MSAHLNLTFHKIFLGIDYLHARTKEVINTLIAVTSWLDAVVACMNVSNPMENWKIDDMAHSHICCDLIIQYIIISRTVMEVWHISTNCHVCWKQIALTDWFTVQRISGLWQIQLKTKAKWLIAFALYEVSV